MNILIVSQYFWPENFKINDFAKALKERNHSVTVLTGKPNYPDGKYFKGYNFFNKRTENYNGIKIVRSFLISRGRGGGARLFINYFTFAIFASFSAIFRLHKKNDLIFVYEPSPITIGIPAIVYKFFSNAPIFFWVQDLWPESLTAAGNVHSKIILNGIDCLVKYIYKRSEVIFISSKLFRKSIIEKGVEEKKIMYLPNWAEELYFSKVERAEEIVNLFPVTGFKILFAGNIGDAQDFESIVKAVFLTRDYNDIHWIILGDGRKKEWVEQQKIEKKLNNLHLLGRFPIDRMPYFFKEADTLLVTLKNEEIFRLTVPAKVQSYLACGRPIIAMIGGAGADIITESKAGFVVNAGDYENLARKVIEMHDMTKANLEKLALSAKEYYADNFNREDLIDKVLELYKTYSGE